MAYAKTTVIHIDHNTMSGGILAELSVSNQRPREFMMALARWLEALAAGLHACNIDVQLNATLAAPATGTLTISGGSGTVGGVIAGTTVTVSWGTSDTATATALAAAINANTTANKLVSATAAAGVVTVTSLAQSKAANSITFTATGTGVTASGSGTLANGAGGDVAVVTYSRS